MYITHRVHVSDGQKLKIKRAIESGSESLTIRLDFNDLIGGNDIIALTKTQIKKVNQAVSNRKGLSITMSPAQLKANLKIEGGFLGALLGLATRFLPTIAKTVLPALGVGALSGLASTGVQKALGDGLYLKKGGCVCSVDTYGKGLYLKSVEGLRSKGDGLYLKRGSSVDVVGKGLILGPNSPFKNIPILGAIL